MTTEPTIIGIGELLWDLLPSGKSLGGAPANFAYTCNRLGAQAFAVSRVGNDALGREACGVMAERGQSLQFIQQDAVHETGTAGVTVGPDGQPSFVIAGPVAWDHLEWTGDLQTLAAKTDVVCFGTLAQRAHITASTIHRFLECVPSKALRICDVNLRQNFYSRELLLKSFAHADAVKLNDQEVIEIARLLAWDIADETDFAQKLLAQFGFRLVCITRGAHGSLLVTPQERVSHAGFHINVADTVGAGDAFTACMVYFFHRGDTLSAVSERANQMAAWVASQVGATPALAPDMLARLRDGTLESNRR